MRWDGKGIHHRILCSLSEKAGCTPIAWAVISEWKIIINGLRNADNIQVIMQMLSRLHYTMGCICRIIAANIKNIAYIVAAQDLDGTFRIMFLQLIATGTKCR